MDISSELLELLRQLLPGFLTAWVFHALTAYPKQSQFERVIQALIFTLLVKVLSDSFKEITIYIGSFYKVFEWSTGKELATSIILAFLLGLVLSYYTNNSKFHGLLQKLKITNQSSFNSEWEDIFNSVTSFVILDLKDGRRIFGWPSVWPSDPSKGHIILQNPEWISENGEYIPMSSAQFIVIKAEEIEFVEFLKEGNSNEQ